ncbi:MAG: InlB B-repeat-containing protein, partial [Erysipelotrichaceae bacterium]|nr:InlB B-repeat-containing protein [Erysipelotrichaceae bacterium]
MPENNPHYVVTDQMPTRSNYLFLGWATTPGGDVEYNPKEYAPVGTQDLNLYAVWGPFEQETQLLTHSLTAHGKTVYYNGQTQSLEVGVEETDNPQTHGPYKYEGWVRVGNTTGENLHHIYAKIDNITASGKDVGTYDTPIAAELYTHRSDTDEFEPLNEYIPINNTELRILPLEITISTESAEKLYDGTPLTAGGTYKIGEGEPQSFGTDGIIHLPNGETIRVQTTGSQTEVGSSENGYVIHWEDEATTADPINYDIQTGTLGTLKVYYNQVKYEKNAGSDPVANMPDDDDEVGTTYQIPSNVPTRDHYTFTGWSDGHANEGTIYQPGDTYTFADDTHSVTFTAQWEAKTVKLIYDPNGGEFRGSTDPTTIEHDYDDMITIAEAATRDHYTFVEWNTKADGSGEAYQPDDQKEFEEDTTLYAIWKVNQYTVTYKDGESGSVFADKSFTED